MFQHILVPLDGSRLAEAALPVTVLLSQKLGAAVTLIHVIEKDAPREIHGEHHLSQEQEALSYLDQAAQAFGPGVNVRRHVHTEAVANVANSIVDHTSEYAPDLIVMCAHGKGGLRDFMTGSIAQQVIGFGKTPVLLIQPDNQNTAPIKFGQFLVPLDENSEHEHGLQVAGALAKSFGATLNLLTVIHTLDTLRGGRGAAGRMLPHTSNALLEMEEEDACQRLTRMAGDLRQQGLEVHCHIRRGDPPVQVVEVAEKLKVDLIVLGTHGKTGLKAFWAGSVGPRIVNATKIPILLSPVRK